MTRKKNTQDKASVARPKSSKAPAAGIKGSTAWQAFQLAKDAPELLKPADIIQLQQTVGNQAAGEMVRSGTREREVTQIGQPLAAAGRVQRELSEKDKEIKSKVDELVSDGKHDEALKLICDKYGFTGGKFTIKTVPPMADAWATTGGEIKEGAEQELKIGKDLFTKDFVFILRTIGHEYQHMVQRSQKNPIGNQKEREFLSWSWEALDESVPKYELEVAAKHAKKALEYYKDMPRRRKKLYKERKKKLKDLIKEAKKSK